jgi:hypothetical protein
MKLDENPSSGSRAVTFGQEDRFNVGNNPPPLFIFIRTRLITGVLKFYIPTGPANVTPANTVLLELLFKRHLEIVS